MQRTTEIKKLEASLSATTGHSIRYQISEKFRGRAGIAVPIPGAPDPAAGFEDAHLQAERAQPVQLMQPGKPGADDDGVILVDRSLDGFRRLRLRARHGLRCLIENTGSFVASGGRFKTYLAVRPPSTANFAPLTYFDSS